MESRIESLIMEIAHCEQIKRYYANTYTECKAIIKSQNVSDIKDFQLPEPFNGNIENSKILIISSNPSIDDNPVVIEREKYPTWTWENSEIIDFFYNRFPKYINEEGRSLRNDGTWSPPIRFESAINSKITEILERSPIPGKDYSLTEIVHCKSKKACGVPEAKTICAKLYLDKIVALAKAKLLIIVGAHARDMFSEYYNIDIRKKPKIAGPKNIQNVDRMVLFIPHPASFGGMKKLKDFLGPVDFNVIVDWLRK